MKARYATGACSTWTLAGGGRVQPRLLAADVHASVRDAVREALAGWDREGVVLVLDASGACLAYAGGETRLRHVSQAGHVQRGAAAAAD
jgi:hypothetical protein